MEPDLPIGNEGAWQLFAGLFPDGCEGFIEVRAIGRRRNRNGGEMQTNSDERPVTLVSIPEAGAVLELISIGKRLVREELHGRASPEFAQAMDELHVCTDLLDDLYTYLRFVVAENS